jgi:regulator of sigma E protease
MHDGSLLLLAGIQELLGSTGNFILAALGIGLVIFIHEAGHFLAAKAFKVRVEVFSLGFGPRLWGFTRHGTDYRIALVPVGGYVKMAGDTPGEEMSGAPDELSSKSVGQRFVIFSAGVVMNMVLAIVLFPIAFAGGVSFPKPEVGGVDAGGPAWKAGLQTGDEVLKVSGRRVYGFQDIGVEVAIGDPSGVPLEIRRNGEVSEIVVVPKKDEEEGRFRIGVLPPVLTKIIPGGPAARAGIKDGERIVAINGEELEPGTEPLFKLSLLTKAVVTVEGADHHRRDVALEATPVAGLEEYRIGISPVSNLIAGLRGQMAQASVIAWHEGDRIERVNDVPIFAVEDWKHAVEQSVDGDGGTITIAVVGSGGGRGTLTVARKLAPDLLTDVALENDLQTNYVRVMPGSAAEAAGLTSGVLIRKVNGESVANFRELQAAVSKAKGAPLELEVARDDAATSSIRVTPRQVVQTRLADWGLQLEAAEVVRKYDIGGALMAGVDSSYYFLANAYLTLQKILSGQVSGKNLGGIISIGYASYTFAEYGVLKLLFFLAILSINLAFINVLPIPILDGGHLFFLIIEKIKGSPVSQRIMGYSQIVGLVLILALMLYVTYNDFARLFRWN